MKKYILIILFICTLFFTKISNAQSGAYQKMGITDLPYPAFNICFDSNDVTHAICTDGDTVFAYTFDSVNEEWNKLAQTAFPNTYNTQYKAHTPTFSFFLDGTLFIILNNGIQRIYKQSGNQFNFVASLDSFSVSKVFVYSDTAFLLGKSLVPNELVLQNFDGISKGKINYFPVNNLTHNTFHTPSAQIDDKIYLSKNNNGTLEIYEHNLITHTTTLFISKNGISSFNQLDNLLNNNGNLTYQDKFQNKVINFSGNSLSDTFLYGLNYYDLTIFKGKYLLHSRNDIWQRVFNNFTQIVNYYDYGSNSDSGFLVQNGDKGLFALPIKTVRHANNNSSLNIAKLNLDSFNSVQYDTLLLKVFLDKDKSGTQTLGDSLLTGYFVLDKVIKSFNVDTFYQYYLPNHIEHLIDANSNTYCYTLPFTGSLSTDFTLPGKSRDTLIFPFIENNAFDLQLHLNSEGRARLNQSSTVNVSIYNYSCFTSSPATLLEIAMPPKATFVNSNVALNSLDTNTNIATFNIPAIAANSFYTFYYDLNYSNNYFSIPNSVKHIAKLTNSNPSFLYDTDSTKLRLVYSYDPNEKLSQPSGIIQKDIDKIKYTIHFQNEGNDYAQRVTVVDTIDTRVPVLSFKMLNASHPYTVSIKNNIVTWVFDNINLQAKSVNEELSRGYVNFEAKVNTKMGIGDSIRNKADIYFDYNSPIATNFAKIQKGEESNNFDLIAKTKGINVYPNPANQNITIKNLLKIDLNIKLYSINGSIIMSTKVQESQNYFYNTSTLPAGIYLIKIEETGETIKLMIQ